VLGSSRCAAGGRLGSARGMDRAMMQAAGSRGSVHRPTLLLSNRQPMITKKGAGEINCTGRGRGAPGAPPRARVAATRAKSATIHANQPRWQAITQYVPGATRAPRRARGRPPG
jgi:hypothetical protein